MIVNPGRVFTAVGIFLVVAGISAWISFPKISNPASNGFRDNVSFATISPDDMETVTGAMKTAGIHVNYFTTTMAVVVVDGANQSRAQQILNELKSSRRISHLRIWDKVGHFVGRPTP